MPFYALSDGRFLMILAESHPYLIYHAQDNAFVDIHMVEPTNDYADAFADSRIRID